MPLQSSNLRLITLGTIADAPPHHLQPPLRDGIHLRWAFDRAVGFPWFGYYLFRRPSGRPAWRCLSRYVTDLEPGGPTGSDQMVTPMAVVTSDTELVLTDDFAPAGAVELDLRDRSWLRAELPGGQHAWRARVSLGFRGDVQRQCVALDGFEPGEVENPLRVEEVELIALDERGEPLPTGQITGGERTGWDAGWSAEIRVPCPAAEVRLTLQCFAVPATVLGYDDAGTLLASATMSGPGIETVALAAPVTGTLAGAAITRVTVIAPQDETQVLTVCWICAGEEGEPVIVATLAGALPLEETAVFGGAGAVHTVELGHDTITAVEVTGGADAAVVDICFALVPTGRAARELVAGGFEPVPGLEQPIALPVDHPDYPCPTRPASQAGAESLALGRIAYGSPAPWAAEFGDLHDRLSAMVDGGPGAGAMVDRSEPVAGSPKPPPEVGGDIVHARQRPLDLVLLGALHPPIAEMVGLAWTDETAAPGQAYDYLLIADHDGSLGGSLASAVAWLAAPDFTVVDGCLALNRVLAPSPPLPPPAGLRCHALPGGTVEVAPGVVVDATNNAGLTWDRKLTGGVLDPGAPVLYHVWRADLGNGADPPAPPASAYTPVTEDQPIPVGRPLPASVKAPAAPEWPPVPMHHIDRALAEGWYAYRVSGVDIFGRHSAPGAPGQWWQWAPRPDPAPWYYQAPPADKIIDPGRIRLLDKIPPPPPTGVEAFALDPADPTVRRDPAWQAWWASLSPAEQGSLIGVRVRWRWPAALARQAPDTREFRIYYQPAPVNAARGRVVSVTPAGATQSVVTTDIATAYPAGTFTGQWLRAGGKSFKIVQSDPGSPLTLRVDNIGAAGEVRPPARVRCAVAIPPGHPLHTDYAPTAAWQDRVLAVGLGEHVTVEASGDRRYEVFLPVPGSPDRSGLPLVTSLAEPLAYGLIGVSAADDKPHTPDSRGEAARFGNESRIGGPATVVRVRRVPPPPPVMPPDSEKVFASPADYHGRSFYTFRWTPSAHLSTHIFRALDHAVFRADLARRPRPPLSTGDPAFPAEFPALRKAAVAAELDALNALDPTDPDALAAYAGLSNDALRVLAALPGVDTAFVKLTPRPLDPDEPDPAAPGGLRWRRVGPDVPAGSLAAGLRAYIDALDGRTRSRWFYRAAYADEVGNAGPLGVAGPPVWLPPVVPPRAPRISRVAGGERAVTLSWTTGREPGLTSYLVYRADDATTARDVRFMTLVGTVPVPAGDPAARPATTSWADDPVPGLVTFTYRVVAVDADGNASAPSPAVAGRAYDTAMPVIPPLTAAWSSTVPPTAAALSWTSADETLLEAQPVGSFAWTPLGGWRPAGAHSEVHPMRGDLAWRFRLRARRSTGATRLGSPVLLASA